MSPGRDYQYYIRGLLFLWWVTSLGILHLLFQGWGEAAFEKVIFIGGEILILLFLWRKSGGVAFKEQRFGAWKIFLLLHPPFLLIWPAEKVHHRVRKLHFYMLVRSLGYNKALYLYDEEVECEEVILKPWPLCLFVVEIPLFRFLRSL